MLFQGSSTMHQLLVSPLLVKKSSNSKRPLKRESHSFDNFTTSNSEISIGQSFHRRSNPNILDLLPPPPPIYAPPSLPKSTIYYAPTNVSCNRYYPPTDQLNSRLKDHSAFNRKHIKIYNGCDSDRYLDNSLNKQKECPIHFTRFSKKQAREIEETLEQELTSFNETVNDFGVN